MVSTALWLVGLIAGQLAFGRPRGLAPRRHRLDDADLDLGDLAIVIPARDEEAVLGLLLEDLGPAAAAGARVIVVDDHSSDGSAAIARRFEYAQLLEAGPLAARRPGKSAACALGARVAVARGARRLLFLDADVRLAPGAVSVLAGTLERH
ncbi:MAG TPA: glycosyltransferase family A protein, partial [Microthrixaceae bacterium]|nr:glycosyltransferase family A protein [Microthrixaceae bacterium]